MADQVWSYLERTGDAKKIEEALSRDAYLATMSVVSINPIVLILGTYPDASSRNLEPGFAHKRWYWLAQIQPNSDPLFRERMQWFSPELKQRPENLTFSEAGVAEIPLPRGKVRLVQEGDRCNTTRE